LFSLHWSCSILHLSRLPFFLSTRRNKPLVPRRFYLFFKKKDKTNGASNRILRLSLPHIIYMYTFFIYNASFSSPCFCRRYHYYTCHWHMLSTRVLSLYLSHLPPPALILPPISLLCLPPVHMLSTRDFLYIPHIFLILSLLSSISLYILQLAHVICMHSSFTSLASSSSCRPTGDMHFFYISYGFLFLSPCQ